MDKWSGISQKDPGSDWKIRFLGEYFIHEILQDELEFSHVIYKKIFDEFVHAFREGRILDSKVFINSADPAISQVTAGLISQKYELSKIFHKREIYLETEDMKLKTIAPLLMLNYKSKRIALMIKEVQSQLLKAQAEADEAKLMALQQQFVLLNTMKMEVSRKLNDRIFI